MDSSAGLWPCPAMVTTVLPINPHTRELLSTILCFHLVLLKVFRCWPSPIPQCCWWLPWVPQAGLSWGQCGALPHVAQRLWRLGQWNSHS